MAACIVSIISFLIHNIPYHNLLHPLYIIFCPHKQAQVILSFIASVHLSFHLLFMPYPFQSCTILVFPMPYPFSKSQYHCLGDFLTYILDLYTSSFDAILHPEKAKLNAWLIELQLCHCCMMLECFC